MSSYVPRLCGVNGREQIWGRNPLPALQAIRKRPPSKRDLVVDRWDLLNSVRGGLAGLIPFPTCTQYPSLNHREFRGQACLCADSAIHVMLPPLWYQGTGAGSESSKPPGGPSSEGGDAVKGKRSRGGSRASTSSYAIGSSEHNTSSNWWARQYATIGGAPRPVQTQAEKDLFVHILTMMPPGRINFKVMAQRWNAYIAWEVRGKEW